MNRAGTTIVQKATKLLVTLMLVIGLSGCLGTVVGVVVDTAIEVAKVPFKVGAAVVDVVTDDDDD